MRAVIVGHVYIKIQLLKMWALLPSRPAITTCSESFEGTSFKSRAQPVNLREQIITLCKPIIKTCYLMGSGV